MTQMSAYRIVDDENENEEEDDCYNDDNDGNNDNNLGDYLQYGPSVLAQWAHHEGECAPVQAAWSTSPHPDILL